ncbi:spore coat protein U [Rahnella sp. AA]|uniref:Csu type fimbrial protein n=1 Tax=Rahnella sp. AA TaxID=2057180 RepID=UPI000C340A95|nr:spore coat protein U domain-containing protein [Rahnella sp. AA]PKE32766.1 spore coat protein U [Rahnella sp. AA]
MNRKGKWIYRVFSGLLMISALFGSIQAAQAACTSSSGAGTFTSNNSFTVGTTSEMATATSGFVCSGSVLSLLSTNTVTATIASTTNATGTTARLYNATTKQYLPYIICQDNGCNVPVNVGSSTTWSSTTLLGLLGLFNASDGSLPLYLKTATGSNLAAGTYTDSININWAYHICFIGVLGACVYTDGTATTSIAVTLIVTNYCYIDNAPNVSFGSAAFPAGFASVTSNALSVRCTLSATYTVNLASSNASNGQYRQMSSTVNSVTSYLQYQLFKADTTVWTAATNASLTGTGLSQSIPYTATVNASQANVPAGSYSDTILVTVTY